MAGPLSYRRAEAEALPLTEDTVRTVIAKTRQVCLAQLAAFAVLAAGSGAWALRTDGPAAWGAGAIAALSLWGVLGAALSTWDHFRVSIVLKRRAPADIAAATDAHKFWWTYRGVFPMSWQDR